ncbi:MAG: response regulator [Candidatus Omnitrophica bacterium]|nr:response regulator [Candidatus Omnitrophota bacterium]
MARQIRVLLVDDEPDFLETVSYWLTSQGYAVALATSGGEALQRIAQQPPHVIFLDLIMPVMDGLETLQRIRSAGVTTPVVLLATTECPPASLVAFGALGISGVFQKQDSLEVFQQVLESALTPRGPSRS